MKTVMYSGSFCRLWGVLLPLALGFAGLTCTEKDDKRPDWEIQRHYQKGNQALSEMQLGVAEGEYKKVIELDPSNAGAFHKLARVLNLQAEKDPEHGSSLRRKAIEALEKSVKLEPGAVLAWTDLAMTYRKAGLVKKSLAAYQKLMKLNPDDTRSQTAMARLLVEAGQPGRAQSVFQSGLAGHPKACDLHLEYGRFLLTQKKDQEAEKQFLAVLPNCPEYYEALDELGSLAARRGDFARVRGIYKKLVELNPSDYMAWELMAAVDEREKNFKAAEESYRRSLEVDRLHMSAWLGLGRVLSAQGRREEAVYAFKKADGFVGSKPRQALELADELVKLSEKDWALSVLERARIAAQDPKLLSAIGEKIKTLSGKRK